MRAQADREELELGRAQGKLLPVSDVTDWLLGRLSILRERILHLPQRIAHRLEGLTKEEINARLMAETEELLRSFEWRNNGGQSTGR